MMLNTSIREALQWMVDCWNGGFEGAEEMVIDFCFYISPFPMVTARQPHAPALPLKGFF